MKGGHAARRHIIAMGHTDLSSIPNVGVNGHRLWLASALWASACFNCSATQANKGWMSPFEAFFGRKPPLTVVPLFQEEMMRVKLATKADVQSARCLYLHGANNHSTSTAVVLWLTPVARPSPTTSCGSTAGQEPRRLCRASGGVLRSPRRPRRPPPPPPSRPYTCTPPAPATTAPPPPLPRRSSQDPQPRRRSPWHHHQPHCRPQPRRPVRPWVCRRLRRSPPAPPPPLLCTRRFRNEPSRSWDERRRGFTAASAPMECGSWMSNNNRRRHQVTAPLSTTALGCWI
ncbi:unnamed protein product [Ectocarpus sp. CCAP 1310/34]|nr:unnamed protein product [Ectocarpus sp. CCAP 1310/34]